MPAAEAAQAERWTIYPTYDVKLGEYFRDNPELEDTFLHVDMQALREMVKAVGPAEPGRHELHVRLVHPDTMAAQKNNPEDRVVHGNAYIMSRGKKRNNGLLAETRPLDSLHCKVTIDELDVLATAQHLKDSATEHDMKPGQSYAFGIPNIVGITHSAIIHELKHVVDFTQLKFRKLEAAYRRKVLGSMAGAMLVSVVASNVAAEEGVKAINEGLIHASQVDSYMAATALGLLGVYQSSKIIIKHALNRVSEKSPLEKRAYSATEDLENVLAPAIKVGYTVPVADCLTR